MNTTISITLTLEVRELVESLLWFPSRALTAFDHGGRHALDHALDQDLVQIEHDPTTGAPRVALTFTGLGVAAMLPDGPWPQTTTLTVDPGVLGELVGIGGPR